MVMSVMEVQEQPPTFLNLPTEVRVLIYKHIFGVDRPHLRIDISGYDFQFYKASDHNSILLTCHKCYAEASPFYQTSLNHLVINLDQISRGNSPFSASNQPSNHHEVWANSLYQSAPYTTLNTIFYSPSRRALLHKVTYLTIPFMRLASLHNVLALTLLPAVQTMELVLTHTTILETAHTQVALLGPLPKTHVVSTFWPIAHINSTKNKMPGESYHLTLFTLLNFLSRNGIQMRWTAKVHWSMLCEDLVYTIGDLTVIQEENGEASRHCTDYIYTHEFKTQKLISLQKTPTPRFGREAPLKEPDCNCHGKMRDKLLLYFGPEMYDMLCDGSGAPLSLYYYEED